MPFAFVDAWRSRLATARYVLLCFATLAVAGLFLSKVGEQYPVREWLVWRYLGYWAATTTYVAAGYAVGDRLLRLVFRGPLAFTTHVPMASALGTLAFGLSIFAIGAVRLLYRPTFFLLPVVLLAVGGVRPWRFLRRGGRRLLDMPAPRGWGALVRWPAWALLFLGVVGLYLPTITPESTGYDPVWYHLPIAEHYASQHGLGIFREGWHLGTLPHFASYLYTWPFLAPGRIFDKMELCLHLELTTVLQVIITIPAAVRLLVRRGWAPWSSATLFLFPSIFLSDIFGGADHVSAVFVLPAWIFLVRAWKLADFRNMAMFALMSGGIMLVKLSAFPVFFALVAPMGARTIWLLATAPVKPWLGAGAALLTGLVVLAPWWLRNALFHWNPFYPNFSEVFTGSRPWNVDAKSILDTWTEQQLWHPPRTWEGQKESLYQVYHFSLQTHDGDAYSGKTPTFGSLFTMTMLVLPFIRSNLRTWGLFALGGACIFGWYSLHHQERYLQTSLPLMTVATIAALLFIAREGRIGCALAVGLVCLQALWGSDVYLLPVHQRFIAPLIALANSGFKKNYEARFHVYQVTFPDADQILPPDARVLVHEHHVHLGLARPSVNDWMQWQSGLNYGRAGSPEAAWRLIQRTRATHLVWQTTSKGYDSIAGDLAFATLAAETTERGLINGHHVGRLPAREPAPRGDLVALLGCNDQYATGMYTLSSLAVPAVGAHKYPAPLRPLAQTASVPDDATYVYHLPRCAPTPVDTGRFQQIMTRADAVMYVLRR